MYQGVPPQHCGHHRGIRVPTDQRFVAGKRSVTSTCLRLRFEVVALQAVCAQ